MNFTCRLLSPFATLLLVASWVSSAQAHSLSGSLGSSAAALHYYQIQCYDDGNGTNGRLEASIKDLSPVVKPLVSMQISRDNSSTNTTDAKDGDATASPLVKLQGEDGFFYITVNKTAAGSEDYSIEFHCMTNDGQHTGTNVYPIINQ